MILLSHATGNENVRQTALAFSEAGLLEEFWTCLNWNPDHRIHRLLPRAVRRQLLRRSFPLAVRGVIQSRPSREIARLLAKFLPLPGLRAHETGALSIDAVMRDLDCAVAARLVRASGCRLVYAYEDGALETFRTAKALGLRRVYDLPIGYWRAAQTIYAEEREREPEWASTLTGNRDSERKLARKEEELRLSEHVVVASTFTKSTLGLAGLNLPVTVAPYGAPEIGPDEPLQRSEKLRVLFVGSLGQRKGLSYLLAAIKGLGDMFALTLLGRKVVDSCAVLDAAVRTHRWIPSLPHVEVLREMRRHDVLVLPSLFEGFGLVILEAMAQGLAVITTAHTGGPDVIEDGAEGFIVPIRSAEEIAVKLDLLLTNRNLMQEMKLAARRRAGQCRWADYRASLVRMAREMVSEATELAHAPRS